MTHFVKIDPERCKGCGLCVNACPKKILELGQKTNSKGYFAVEIREESKCIGCAFCALSCPDLALEVYRKEKGE